MPLKEKSIERMYWPIGEVAETLPHWLMLTATGLLLVLSVPVLIHRFAPAGPVHS